MDGNTLDYAQRMEKMFGSLMDIYNIIDEEKLGLIVPLLTGQTNTTSEQVIQDYENNAPEILNKIQRILDNTEGYR